MKTELRALRCRYTFELPHKLRDEYHAVCRSKGLESCIPVRKFVKKYVEGDRALLEAMKEKYQIDKEGD